MSELDEGRAERLSGRRVLHAEVTGCFHAARLHVAVALVECRPVVPAVPNEENLLRATCDTRTPRRLVRRNGRLARRQQNQAITVLKDDACYATTVEQVGARGKVHAL